MNPPSNFGGFHLAFIGLVLLGTWMLCRYGRNASARQERKILMIFWAVIVVLEVYKELQFAMRWTEPIAENPVTWSYAWYAFPFQFCSSPFYILPIAALAKHDRLRDTARMFLAVFSLFAGLVVYIYPNDVFVRTIGINIQTMVHHGTQVVLGFYLGMRLCREGKLTLPYYLRAVCVFCVLVCIALGLNLAAPLFTDETFNMFYIGPRFPCSLAILDQIYLRLPYPVFLALYVLGFSFAALLMLGLHKLPAHPITSKQGKILKTG
ncbi:MAG: YwaF family protein [Oscillospiraceae bacterium]|nr:YwaF family protein [Oscillospiraceae bacterium]